MSFTRTRSDPKYSKGTMFNYRPNGGPFEKSYQVSGATVQDFVASGDNHAFYLDKWRLKGGTWSGSLYSGELVYTKWPVEAVQGSGASYLAHADITTASSASLAATLLQRTNPSRPSVDTPVAFAELGELPGLIRELGNSRIQKMVEAVGKGAFKTLTKAAKLNLIYQFGILPLYSDVQKLLIFQKYVDQRVAELKRLRTRGLRRTVVLVNESKTTEPRFVTLNSAPYITCWAYSSTQLIIKGHVRYTLVDPPTVKTDNQLRLLAFRIVSGATLDPSTLWELLPWSWLVDWFTNVGDMIAARRNLVNCTHDIPRIIAIRRSTTVTERYNNVSSLSVDPLSGTRITGSRNLVSATMTAQLPILTDRQLSILGSLAVLRV